MTATPGAGLGLVADRLGRERPRSPRRRGVTGRSIFAREFEIALVVRRARRRPRRCHSPSARNSRCRPAAATRDRADGRPRAGVEALLLGGLELGRGGAARLALGDERGGLRIGRGERLRERVIGGDGDEARAEDRVGPGGEDLDRVDAGRPARRGGSGTAGRGSCRSSSPASAGPCRASARASPSPSSSSSAKSVIFRNHWASLRRSTSAPERQPRAVDHLLVGEHGHVDRVPIDRAFLAIDQAGREQVEEQRLLVAVISRARRSRARGSSRARSRAASAASSSSRCWRGSSRRDGPCAPSPHSRPACRTRPSPSGGALRGPASAGSARARRPSCSCGHGPCGCAPTDRGTSRARRSWAWCWRCRRAKRARLGPARLPAAVGLSRVEAPAAHGDGLARGRRRGAGRGPGSG